MHAPPPLSLPAYIPLGILHPILQMLDVVTETRCDGEALAESSHDAWVATTPPPQAPGPNSKGTWSSSLQGRRARASHDDTGSPRLLLTGGGIGHAIPRQPRVRVLSLADRTVRIELPPPPTDCHAFRRQCEEVSVLGESSAGTAEMELARCRPGPFWGSDPASPIELAEPSFFRAMEADLLTWNRLDPPDAGERARSTSLYSASSLCCWRTNASF